MGMAMLILAPMAVFTTRERIRLCTVLGLVIAGLAPVVSMIDGASVPWILRSYFFPSYNYFGFFPWASFLAFGMVAGSVLRTVKADEMSRAMQWMLAIGIGLAVIAQQLSNMPYSIYAKSEFWLNSPALIFIKLGSRFGVPGARLFMGESWRDWKDGVCFASSERRRCWCIGCTSNWCTGDGSESGSRRSQFPRYSSIRGILLALMTVISVGRSRWESIWASIKPVPLTAAPSGIGRLAVSGILCLVRSSLVRLYSAHLINMRVLVVEDEKRIADFLSRGLQSAGYAVDVVHTGSNAIERVHSTEYDLIILDLGLPDIDGLQVLQKIKNRKTIPPVLILSARDAVDDRVKGLEQGADDYLVKPFAFVELLARARVLLRRGQPTPEKIAGRRSQPRLHPPEGHSQATKISSLPRRSSAFLNT